MHMSYYKFSRLYSTYKDNFDTEMLLLKSGTTYEKATEEADIDDVIPF